MPSSRRCKLEAMLADDPADAFLRYSLALELEKEGEHARSLEILRELMSQQTPYVPAFVMAGQHLVKQGCDEDARKVFIAGVAAARRAGDDHAAGEMSEFLMQIQD